MILKKAILTFVLIISFVLCFSQKSIPDKLLIDGMVSGYYQNTSNDANKNERQIKLEGVLENVSICVLQDNKTVFSVKSNKKGTFKLELETGKIYQIELSKIGYLTSNLLIDLTGISKEISSKGLILDNLEILLNSYNSDNSIYSTKPFGRLFFDVNSGSLNFEELNIKIRKGIFSKEKIENPSISLIKKAVLNNKNNKSLTNVENDKVSDVKTGSSHSSKSAITPTFTLKIKKIESYNDDEIQKRESELLLARKQIEKDKLNAQTARDSVIIMQRESLLISAENELSSAKKFIEIQKKVISVQKWKLFLLMGFLLLLIVLLLVVIINYRQRKKTHLLLEQKNKKITDSINYARRIQQSILLNDEEIKKIVPDSFIFYQPRDIVSGDFYWFSEIDQKIIFAAVDCTGHGVPGACMSFIGHSIMNEIINEKKITKPSKILSKLHSRIVSLLHQNSGDLNSQDGMELSLCVYDKKNKTLEYSGAMTPAYIIKNKEILILNPDEFAIGGINIHEKNVKEIVFTDKKIPVSENDILYMFSDGYVDQFGSDENIKFNIQRFKNLLLEIHEKKLNIQKSFLEDTINNWKGKNKQIDDILVIGVKF